MDAFLSYSRRDAAFAAALNAELTGRGVSTFFDQRDLPAGQLWVSDLERAIERDAQAVVVLFGPAGLGNTQQIEYQLALTRQNADRSFPVIPVILPRDRNAVQPNGFIGLQTWVDFSAVAHPGQDPVGLQRLVAAIRREHLDADTVRDTTSPYKGLGSFKEEDSGIFFGRDADAEALLGTVRRHKIAAVIGSSGAGKSSLVRAGLLPRLRRKGEHGFDGVWDTLDIRPGHDPLLALVNAVVPRVPGQDELTAFRDRRNHVEDLRKDGPNFLAEFLRDRMGEARLHVDRTLILVDQAEELFIPSWNATREEKSQFHADSAQFIRLLLGAAEQGPASVVFTVRHDYFDRLMDSPFNPHLKDTQILLGRIPDLRPAIEQPAKLVNLSFAPGLIDRIIGEVGDEDSNLPLMQLALERTWQQPRPPKVRVLTHDAYEASGGVQRAINLAATTCYDSLSSDTDRNAARRLLLRLVRPGDRGAHTRNLAPVPEDATERKVMDIFALPERRLIFVSQRDGVATMELAHDALVRGWPKLLEWAKAADDKLRVRDAVQAWKSRATGAELLPLDSGLLKDARALLGDQGDVRLSTDLEAYIRASVAAEDRMHWWGRAKQIAVGTAAVVFSGVAVVAVVFYLSSEANLKIANDERERAEDNANIAQGAANGLIFEIAQGLENQQGISVTTVRRILDAAMGVIDRMLTRRPNDTSLLRLKAAASAEFADVFARSGDGDSQLDMARQSISIFQKLADAAPNDLARQRDLSVSFNRIGDVQVQKGALDDALASFQAGLAIAERLAKADTANAEWQRDLSVSFNNIGDVQVQKGALDDALASFQASHSIFERLAKADTANAGWQRDLSVSFEKIGNVQVEKGALDDALASFRGSLSIRERLAKADPANAGWQRDLAVSHSTLGRAYRDAKDGAQARRHLTAGREIMADLVRRYPAWAQWKQDLAWFDGQIASLPP